MTKSPSCPSEFALERLRFGELAGSPEERLVMAHLDGCLQCCGRQRALAEAESPSLDGAAIWARGSSGRPAPSRLSWRSPRMRWAMVALVGATAVATVAFLVPRPAPDILTKGSATKLGVIAKRHDGSTTRLESGARLSQGDRLRFDVLTRLPRASIALVMLDGAGVVTRLAPRGGGDLSIAGGTRVLLDEAVELDGDPGAERIVLVACSHAVDANEVVAKARHALADAGGNPLQVDNLGTGCEEETFSMTKVKP
jgi:hypothetical protein